MRTLREIHAAPKPTTLEQALESLEAACDDYCEAFAFARRDGGPVLVGQAIFFAGVVLETAHTVRRLNVPALSGDGA